MSVREEEHVCSDDQRRPRAPLKQEVTEAEDAGAKPAELGRRRRHLALAFAESGEMFDIPKSVYKNLKPPFFCLAHEQDV